MFRVLWVMSMLFLGACSVAPDRADVYTGRDVGTEMRVEYAEVIALRAVNIRLEQGNEEIGAASGAVVGGVLGSGVSDNRRAATVGSVVGAVLGGTVGRVIGRDSSMTPGWEIMYQLPSGETRMIVQPRAGLENLHVGQKIRLIYTPEGIRVSPVLEDAS